MKVPWRVLTIGMVLLAMTTSVVGAGTGRHVTHPYVGGGAAVTGADEPVGNQAAAWFAALCVVGGACLGQAQSGETTVDLAIDDHLGDPTVGIYKVNVDGTSAYFCDEVTDVPVSTGDFVYVYVLTEIPADAPVCPGARPATAGNITASFR